MEHWLFVGFALVLVILAAREVYLSTLGRRQWFDAARRFGLSPRGSHPCLEASGTYRGLEVRIHHEVQRAGKSLRVTHIITLKTASDSEALVELLQAHGFDAQQEGKSAMTRGPGPLSAARLTRLLEALARHT